MLSRINAAMLPAGTAKAYHEMRETAFDEAFGMMFAQRSDMTEEFKYFTVFFKEINDFAVEPRLVFVGFVSARIVRAATIEHISSAIAARIVRNAFFVTETHDRNGQRSLIFIF